MAARGARLRKYGVSRIHRAAEIRRTVGTVPKLGRLPCVTGQCTLTPPKHSKLSMLTRDNSINMSSIEIVLAAVEALEPGKQLSHTKIAREHRVHRFVLSRRHRGQTAS
jgi:hypothetical protein